MIRLHLGHLRKIKSRVAPNFQGSLMKRTALALSAAFISFPLAAQEQPTRPPITGIAHVRIYSTDLHKSADFYSRTLGAPARNGGCTGMTRPCLLVNDHQQILFSEVASASPANLLAEIAFATPDLARMRSYLLAHNVAAGPVTRDISAVAHFSLRDPEGNSITFVQLHPRTVFTAPAGQISTRMLHAGFIVKDRAAEDRFYKDVLGFHVYWHGGRKDDETNWVDMQVPDGTDWIEYMLNVPANADHHTLGVMNHIALGVTDIHAAEAQLRTNGWSGNEQPKIGRDGKWQLNLYDPDDTRVELMEFTPTQKPCCSEYTGPHPKP
jgi:catechol 2,3-dioxygenase-like lactoylglutathione lyase family enzyme